MITRNEKQAAWEDGDVCPEFAEIQRDATAADDRHREVDLCERVKRIEHGVRALGKWTTRRRLIFAGWWLGVGFMLLTITVSAVLGFLGFVLGELLRDVQ